MSKQANEALRLINHTLSSWAQRNLDEKMRHIAEDVEFLVNVDSEIAPFAASASGAAEVRQRLQLMLETFYFDAFVFDAVKLCDEAGTAARVAITYFYREKTTNQHLDGRFRLNFYLRDGEITRVEELHDSGYVEAFARLIKALTATMERTP